MLHLDGSQGEGGGQVVRTAVTLSSITGTPVQIENIRAGRDPRGLRAQHVAAIQAAAALCDAKIEGVEKGSETVTFEPGREVAAGEYEWGVGTAGSAVLVLQTVLLPLVLADGKSTVQVSGGTHVPNAPTGHYLRDVYMPLLLRMGADIEIYMDSYGWLPEGGGQITAYINGGKPFTGLDMKDRGRLERIFGTAVGCNLPSHIPQRMANRATNLLNDHVEAPLDIRPQRTRSVSTGAGIFLTAEYENGRCGFGCLGRKGMPSEAVAERAVTDILNFMANEATVDRYATDQLILPLALAEGQSAFRAESITRHCRTNIAVVRSFTNRPIFADDNTRMVSIGAAP